MNENTQRERESQGAGLYPTDTEVMLLIGELQGSMVGLTDDDLADCAVTFAEKMQRYRPSRDGEASLEPLFVHACARNHARDSLRAVVRSARRTVSLDEHPDA